MNSMFTKVINKTKPIIDKTKPIIDKVKSNRLLSSFVLTVAALVSFILFVCVIRLFIQSPVLALLMLGFGLIWSFIYAILK
jgi:hypothetical protein